jgi:hypothetical protein
LRLEGVEPDSVGEFLSAIGLGMTATVAFLLLWLSAKTLGAGLRYLRAFVGQT